LSLSSKILNHSKDQINKAKEQGINQINKDSLDNQIIKKIDLITKGQKQYIKRILKDIFNSSIENAENVCDFIIAEKNEINIKESIV